MVSWCGFSFPPFVQFLIINSPLWLPIPLAHCYHMSTPFHWFTYWQWNNYSSFHVLIQLLLHLSFLMPCNWCRYVESGCPAAGECAIHLPHTNLQHWWKGQYRSWGWRWCCFHFLLAAPDKVSQTSCMSDLPPNILNPSHASCCNKLTKDWSKG